MLPLRSSADVAVTMPSTLVRPAPALEMETVAPMSSVSVIVPTYREAENLLTLIERLEKVRQAGELDLELLIMDDDSDDGSVEAVGRAGRSWATIHVRTTNRGLSPAVIDGMRAATGDILIVMDADLSHPPEKIPEMIAALRAGAPFVLGSRYVPGGSTDAAWGVFRWLNSQAATLLARPLTNAKDPMSGFFAMRRDDFNRADGLNPIGYKIALELIVKCRFDHVAETPIHFADREHGQSKLSLKEQLKYIQHLRRLYIFKFGTWSHLVQFLVVGASGVLVNLSVLMFLARLLTTPKPFAVAVAITLSMVSNFMLNRRFTFSYARSQSIMKQFFGFCTACSIGAGVNFITTMLVHNAAPDMPLEAAAIAGIAAGMGFNFLASRFVVFRSQSTAVHQQPNNNSL